jgi:hypothetical protein
MAYVRASGDLATVRDGYTRVVKALGHRSLRNFFITSSAWVDRALLQQRFAAGLAAFAAAITSLLACMGVYGMLAYSVAARVRELGVRLALGAARGTVVWMIVRDGLAIAVPGVLIGAPCAWAAARLVRAQLYGIAPVIPNAADRRSHISCDGARGVMASGAARVEGSARPGLSVFRVTTARWRV